MVIGVVPRSGQIHRFLGHEAAGKWKEIYYFTPLTIVTFAVVHVCVGECTGDDVGERDLD